MDENRAHWNEQHKALRAALRDPARLEEARQLFMQVHAPLHARSVSAAPGWNFEEKIWDGLTEAEFRCIPAGEEHSIAWCLWHLARIEDLTLNLLVARSEQVFTQESWAERLHAPIRDSSNESQPVEVRALSERVAFAELRAYRSAVGQRTRVVVSQLTAAMLRRKTNPADLQRILNEGGIKPAASGVLDYWGGLTVAGLLLMPPTRHNLVHLNECQILKKKARRA
jgi:hypothetical protein